MANAQRFRATAEVFSLGLLVVTTNIIGPNVYRLRLFMLTAFSTTFATAGVSAALRSAAEYIQ